MDAYDIAFDEFLLTPAKQHVNTKHCSNVLGFFLLADVLHKRRLMWGERRTERERCRKKREKVLAATPVNWRLIKAFIWNYCKCLTFLSLEDWQAPDRFLSQLLLHRHIQFPHWYLLRHLGSDITCELRGLLYLWLWEVGEQCPLWEKGVRSQLFFTLEQ